MVGYSIKKYAHEVEGRRRYRWSVRYGDEIIADKETKREAEEAAEDHILSSQPVHYLRGREIVEKAKDGSEMRTYPAEPL